MRVTSKYEETRVIPTYRKGCKNLKNLVDDRVPESRDTHTQVLLMDYL